jgi:ATP-dependent helicase HrpB
LFKKSIKNPPSAESAQILAKEVMNGNLKLKGWGDKCNVWISRVEFVSRFFPEYEIPKFEDADKLLVLTDLCEGALSYKEIKDKDCWPFLQNWLSGLHADVVNKIAPERIKLKNGTEVKVIYGNNGPKISVLLQRLYDVDSTPLLHDGRIPITVEILAPNHRPVQTTNDLSSFWKDSYSNVKKQLKGRYPKHEWR